jgi:small multidrug resistance family-3 protein
MTAFWYVLAAVAEIAGCFAFWAWLRNGASPSWLAPGMASLALFAWALTRIGMTECNVQLTDPRTGF